MDVPVLIVSHLNHTYQVCVLTPDRPARRWIKAYDSKLEWAIELHCIDLITAVESNQALSDNFEADDKIVIIRSKTEEHMLRAAGFVEKKPDMPN
jgi:hypothetical protein